MLKTYCLAKVLTSPTWEHIECTLGQLLEAYGINWRIVILSAFTEINMSWTYSS